MPANVVHSKHEEKEWKQAKEAAEREGHEGDYAYIMGVYERLRSRVGGTKGTDAYRKDMHRGVRGYLVRDEARKSMGRVRSLAKALSAELKRKVDSGAAHWVTVKEGPLEGRHLLIDGPRPSGDKKSTGKILAGHGIPPHVIEKITGATHAHHLEHEPSVMPGDIIRYEGGHTHMRVYGVEPNGDLKVKELTHNGVRKKETTIPAKLAGDYKRVTGDEEKLAHQSEEHAHHGGDFEEGDLVRDNHREYQVVGYDDKDRLIAKELKAFGKPSDGKEVKLSARTVKDLQYVGKGKEEPTVGSI